MNSRGKIKKIPLDNVKTKKKSSFLLIWDFSRKPFHFLFSFLFCFSSIKLLFLYVMSFSGRSPYHSLSKSNCGGSSGLVSQAQSNGWDSPSINSDSLTNGSSSVSSGGSGGHSRNPSNASSCSSSLSDSLPRSVGDVFKGFIIGYHRKMVSSNSLTSVLDLFGSKIVM